MNKKIMSLGIVLISLCSCSSYQGVSVDKAIKILESVQSYSEYDIPTSLHIASSLLIYSSNDDTTLIKSENNVYEMSYGKKTMHISKYEDDDLITESYGGVIEDKFYIFIDNKDGKRCWEVDNRLYNTILLNFMGLMQASFSEESNFSDNLSYLDKINDDKDYYKGQYEISSKGKGNLKIVKKRASDKDSYIYDKYRLSKKESLNYALNHSFGDYDLESGEHHRFNSVNLIYSGIKIKLPKLTDYNLVVGTPPSFEIENILK